MIALLLLFHMHYSDFGWHLLGSLLVLTEHHLIMLYAAGQTYQQFAFPCPQSNEMKPFVCLLICSLIIVV